MTGRGEFAVVALAHFVALLIPGVDFFLIARSALLGGMRSAAAACVGIALANAVFIVAAFSGLSLVSNRGVLNVIQLAGGVFLLWMGVAFIRAKVRVSAESGGAPARQPWLRNLGAGFTTGLLNPKNALFYLSLAAALQGADAASLLGDGAWMFGVVLIWDLGIAALLSSGRELALVQRVLPWLVRLAGVVLVLFGCGMLLTLALP